MAANLQKYLSENTAGWDSRLHVYNRSVEKADPVVELGAIFTESPKGTTLDDLNKPRRRSILSLAYV
jgi:hypothetical protein